MRITDCRYDRDRLRLTVAYRLIAYGVRTQVIRHCTGLSGDRIRKLHRNYLQDSAGLRAPRKRGKSPRQMSYFRRCVDHEIQAATLGCMLCCCGLLSHPPRLPGPAIGEVCRFCDVYDTFVCICPDTAITWEHAWFLGEVLSSGDEYVLTSCPDCRAAWIRDKLDILPFNCATCRNGQLPESTDEDC